MKAILQLYWNLCRFKAKPSDVPHSWFLLGVVALINYLLGLWGIVMEAGWAAGLWKPIILSLVFLGVYGLVIYVIHRIRRVGERFVQVMSGLLGAGAIISLLSMIVTAVLGAMILSLPGTFLATLSHVIMYGLMTAFYVWYIAIEVMIFKYSLELRIFGALLVAVLVEALAVGLYWLLVG